MAWDLSCRDWQDRIKEGRSLVPELPLDHDRAEAAVALFDLLRLSDVPGNPTMAEACGEWFRDIVRALFGSWDPETQTRHIREIFALVGKKNSKTSYGAGLMLVALMMNQRPRAKFLLVAPTQDVAELAFSQCEGMVKLSEYCRSKLDVKGYIKKIIHYDTLATLEVMSFDPQVLTGQKPTGFLLDEVHIVSQSSKAGKAVGQLRGGMIAQPEAFGLFTTTQSDVVPAGVFRAELNRARGIRDGTMTGPMLPVLYEFPPDIAEHPEAWQDPTNWHMVVPNNGRSITVPRLVEEFKTAQDLGTEEVQRWASQHLNIEIGLGLRSDRWVGADLWRMGAEPGLTLDAILARSDVVVVGIDGGGADDLFGLAVLGRDEKTREWLHWGKAWAQRLVLERRKQIAPRLLDFEKAGELTFIDEPGPEIEEVVEIVARIEETGLLAQVGLDPMGVGEVVDALAERGIDGPRVVGVPQGWRLSGPIKTVERKLANKSFRHAAQGIMAWSVGNAKAEPRGNATAIDKAAAGSAKIDPLVALLCAVALMSRNPEPSGGRSIFERAELWESSTSSDRLPAP